jgi:uncharacterized protein YndB with AHSA1/START domain
MFRLQKILYSVIGAAVLLASGGWFMPRHARVERTIVIGAPPAAVFSVVNDIGAIDRWSPWYERDRSMRPASGSPRAGVGARLVWDGDPAGVGSGEQEIVESRFAELVTTRMDFGPQGSATGHFRLSPEGDGTRVVWTFDMDLGFNPVGRYFGPFFDQMLGPDYERGLANLKRLCEALPKG